MTPCEKDEFRQILQRLTGQFLCGYAINSIDWQQIRTYTSWEQQKQLLDSTCKHPLNQLQAIKLSYQLNFLKRLLQFLECNCAEVHDEIYETYCQLQQKASPGEEEDKYAYKHYLLPAHQTHFTLRESKSFVAEGTTGLCSWQASLALADYLLHNPQIVANKSVLELGAGTGLCGFIISRCCEAKRVCLTDGSLECIQLMRENMQRNFANSNEVGPGYFKLEEKLLICEQLAWSSIDNKEVEPLIKTDVILAADVVYDTSVLPELSQAVDYIFKSMQNAIKMLLAATVRNEETLVQFLHLLDKLHFTVTEVPVIELENSELFWDRSTPVKLFMITKNICNTY